MEMKKVYMITFGCQMNVYDSSRIIDILKQKNYEEIDNLNNADVVIINTCHIREKASEKIFSELGKLKKLKQKKIEDGKYLVIVVAGCAAVAEGKNIFKKMPIVDIVVGGESYHKISEMIDIVFENQEFNERTNLIDIDFKTEEKFSSLPKNRNIKSVCETLTIQDGCDKFCSYCVVPYTRGREYSRPFNDIIDEAYYLVDNGVKEITLLGQNVDNYRVNKDGKIIELPDVIEAISTINGIERIRYLTSYPSQFSDDLIYAHRDIKKLMPLVYIPVQSGSDRVLKLMNRKYTREQYFELVQKIRDNVKNVAFSSDFIVGFAGEKEDDFKETLDLVEKVNFSLSFSFKYSLRPGTVGIKMPDQVDENIKIDRLNRLQELLNKQQIDFNQSFINREVTILVENKSKENENVFFGRTEYSQAVMLDKKDFKVNIGDLVNVKILDANLRTLSGEVLNIVNK